MNSLYAAAKPDKDIAIRLRNHFMLQGVPDVLPVDDFHSTIVYSTKAPVNYERIGSVNIPRIYAMPVGLECWPTKTGKNALVMRLYCPRLNDMHNSLMDKHELSYDFDEYKPHMTISYDIKLFDWEKLSQFNSPIEFVNFYDDEIDEDWRK